ncbi:MAG TPA: LON peptidase substrate-binding domain-containing protein [Pirellulales bacterium]|jgi:Lon protease-like protein|nr:LON peptidase substrate-binding domain-containing protein [Pirellulales bacterium]
MFEPEEFSFSLAEFRGVARLFPLPNLVMFPQVMQPLHIFEPRYRALFEEALADDKLIALATLEPGWEPHYEGRPPLRPAACLCRIATHTNLPDGCYNVLLIGLRRIRLKNELPPHKLFREAEVEVLEDDYPLFNAPARPGLQRRLVKDFKRALPKLSEVQEHLDQLLGAQVPLGLLTDIIAYTLQLPLEVKLQLLAEPDVDRRANTLLSHLTCEGEPPRPAGDQPFPPAFSVN